MKDCRVYSALRRFAVLLLAVAPFATAGLLVDPTGGTSVGLPTSLSQVTRELGGTFDLYGTNITAINIAAEGFLGTANLRAKFADRDVDVLAESTSDIGLAAGPVIAAFYDRFAFGPDTTVTDKSVPNEFYAVTYQQMLGFDDPAQGKTSDFQVVLFMSDRTLNGFQFLAGDIAISYGQLASVVDGTLTVGVALDGTNFTGTPISPGGQLPNVGTLPAGSGFLLYRPQPEFTPHAGTEQGPQQVTYDVSVQVSNTPEPATFALIGIGLTALGVWKKR